MLMKPKDRLKIRRLAKAFCDALCDEMGADDLASIIHRNAIEQDPNVCHTHDYVDANQVMLNAITATGDYANNVDINSDRIVALTSAAWNLAKAVKFAKEAI